MNRYENCIYSYACNFNTRPKRTLFSLRTPVWLHAVTVAPHIIQASSSHTNPHNGTTGPTQRHRPDSHTCSNGGHAAKVLRERERRPRHEEEWDSQVKRRNRGVDDDSMAVASRVSIVEAEREQGRNAREERGERHSDTVL